MLFKQIVCLYFCHNRNKQGRGYNSLCFDNYFAGFESGWAGGGKTTICSSYLPFIQLTGENQYSFRFIQARYETMSENKK